MADPGLQGKQIAFIGAGNMAEALIKGLLQSQTVAAAAVAAADVLADRRQFMAATYGIRTASDNRGLVAAADVIVMAIKPQVAAEVLAAIAPATGPDKLMISIVAGLTNATMVKADWIANVIPGIQVVPSGVLAVNGAQEKGCSYCFAG